MTSSAASPARGVPFSAPRQILRSSLRGIPYLSQLAVACPFDASRLCLAISPLPERALPELFVCSDNHSVLQRFWVFRNVWLSRGRRSRSSGLQRFNSRVYGGTGYPRFRSSQRFSYASRLLQRRSSTSVSAITVLLGLSYLCCSLPAPKLHVYRKVWWWLREIGRFGFRTLVGSVNKEPFIKFLFSLFFGFVTELGAKPGSHHCPVNLCFFVSKPLPEALWLRSRTFSFVCALFRASVFWNES